MQPAKLWIYLEQIKLPVCGSIVCFQLECAERFVFAIWRGSVSRQTICQSLFFTGDFSRISLLLTGIISGVH